MPESQFTRKFLVGETPLRPPHVSCTVAIGAERNARLRQLFSKFISAIKQNKAAEVIGWLCSIHDRILKIKTEKTCFPLRIADPEITTRGDSL
jgi:hypothetical protein